jgi:hypothetical protein
MSKILLVLILILSLLAGYASYRVAAAQSALDGASKVSAVSRVPVADAQGAAGLSLGGARPFYYAGMSPGDLARAKATYNSDVRKIRFTMDTTEDCRPRLRGLYAGGMAHLAVVC